MKRADRAQAVPLLLASACVYLLLDLPARLTGFMGLASFAGPKNFLPLLLGLLLGPWSVPGIALGMVASAALGGSPPVELVAELLSVPILALGGWRLWYVGQARPPSLKRGRDYARFFGITALLAPLSGLPALLLLGGEAWFELTVFCAIFTLLVGMPVLILATSILCIRPICPAGKTPAPDVFCKISSRSGGLDAANEQIENFCAANGVPLKKAMAVESCLEELALRIQSGCADAEIEASLYISDSASLFLSFSGARYNPLLRQPDEAPEDLWGLMLIRERALRASHRYAGGVNLLHIVQ